MSELTIKDKLINVGFTENEVLIIERLYKPFIDSAITEAQNDLIDYCNRAGEPDVAEGLSIYVNRIKELRGKQ